MYPENPPSHARSRAGRFNVFSDSLQTSPPTAPRVHRQETRYPQLQDENDGNAVRPTERYAQSGNTNRQDSQKPTSSAAQPSRHEGREPFTDITGSTNNNASQPASSIPVAGTAQINTTNPTTQPIPERTFRQGPGGRQAYLKPYKHMGKPRFAGNDHLAEYSSLLLTHPQVVQEWQNNSPYTKEEISQLLQYYVQVSQTTSPKTVYDIMDKRSLHQSMWHKLDHRVFHRSTGGIPRLGSVIPNQPVADTSVNQFQPDFADGAQGYEFRHYPRSWEQLPIGTRLSDILDRYPNHIKHEHLGAFAAHGISANQMWNLVPNHLKALYKSAYLVKTDDEANLFFKRMSQRKNMVVTRYGGAAYNAMVTSDFKLRDPGQSVQTRRAQPVSNGFIANPADWLDYQHQHFSAPSVVRRNEDTYKRDEAAAKKKKKKPAAKKDTVKSKKSATSSSDTKQIRRLQESRTDTTSVIDPQLTQSTDINDRQARRAAVDEGFAPPAPSKKRRYVDSDDDDDEERVPNNDFEPPQKRQRVDSFRSYAVSQPPPPRQYIDRDPLLQARYDGPVYYGYAPLNRQFSNSRVGPVDAPGYMARPQLAPRQVESPLQPQATSSPRPSVAGQKRRRDDAEEQHSKIMTVESMQPAAKKLKQTAAGSNIDVSSLISPSTLDKVNELGQQEEETLDNPGTSGWFDLGMGDQAAEYNEPDSFTELLEAGSPGVDWASIPNTGSVPELTEPLPLSSDNQHTNADNSGQVPKLTTEEEQEFLNSIADYEQYTGFESAAPSYDSPLPVAQDNVETIYQPPQPRVYSPEPLRMSKRGRDEFEEDVQNPQEPSMGHPLKKLKQTTVPSEDKAADTSLPSQDGRSVTGGGDSRAGRDSMSQVAQQVEPSVQTTEDSQLNVANDPFSLTSIEGNTDNSLAFLGDLDHSNPYNSAGDIFTLGGSPSSAPFLADDSAGADFDAEFDAMFGAPSGPELGDAAGRQVDNWPR